jgi:hypothetical protein
VIALACALPAETGVPLSRWSASELAREAVTRGLVEQISGVTVWRWLSADAIKPWQHRSWMFPRDPHFAARAGPILDLYQGRWQGERLHPGDYVLCADENPRSKRATASTARCRQPAGRHAASASNTTTNARARSATSPPGMPSARRSSIAARPRTASSHSTRSSTSS